MCGVRWAGRSTGFLISASGEVRCGWCRDGRAHVQVAFSAAVCSLRAPVLSPCRTSFKIVAYKIVPHLLDLCRFVFAFGIGTICLCSCSNDETVRVLLGCFFFVSLNLSDLPTLNAMKKQLLWFGCK